MSKCCYMKITNLEMNIGTYRAFNLTKWSSKHEVSWKKIFRPCAGRFCAAITSSRNSIVWAASLSALFLCWKHFLAFDVPSNGQVLIVTIRINMITVNDKSTRNRKFCRKKYFVRVVRRNILLKINHWQRIFSIIERQHLSNYFMKHLSEARQTLHNYFTCNFQSLVQFFRRWFMSYLSLTQHDFHSETQKMTIHHLPITKYDKMHSQPIYNWYDIFDCKELNWNHNWSRMSINMRHDIWQFRISDDMRYGALLSVNSPRVSWNLKLN